MRLNAYAYPESQAPLYTFFIRITCIFTALPCSVRFAQNEHFAGNAQPVIRDFLLRILTK